MLASSSSTAVIRGKLPPSAPTTDRQSGLKSGTILEKREAVTSIDVATEAEVEPEPAPGTLRERLAKARSTFAGAFSGVLGRSGDHRGVASTSSKRRLLRADVGVAMTSRTNLLGGLRDPRAGPRRSPSPRRCSTLSHVEMAKSRLAWVRARRLNFATRWTTVRRQRVDVRGRQRGRQDHHDWQARQAAGRCDGRTVLLAAGDTFRAAAAEQLTTWADRSRRRVSSVVRTARDSELGHLRRRRAGRRRWVSSS